MDRTLIAAVVCGLLFGGGLVVSDMINPARVLGFLDLLGAWDPSLGLVMAGALVPSVLAYRVRMRLDAPLFAAGFQLPDDKRRVDRDLALGAVLFGAGWGLVGFCPGPALAALVLGRWEPVLFVAAMLGGMAAHRLATERPAPVPGL